jgi:hypothetical protein
MRPLSLRGDKKSLSVKPLTVENQKRTEERGKNRWTFVQVDLIICKVHKRKSRPLFVEYV